MLIYCNQLMVDGEGAFANLLRSIAGWLKESTGKHFTLDELLSGNDFELEGQRVRTYKADVNEPKSYAILFSNPDAKIHGRQWITEIGLRVEEGKPIFFTLLLEVSDISTRVKERPTASKPKLINYINQNCTITNNTIGINLKFLGPEKRDLVAFDYEIQKPEREYPIVLLSQNAESEAAVNPKALQGHLLGLAQVVECDKDIDSWMMERELTKRYSAWGGAINIIFPNFGKTFCRNQLLTAYKLKDLQEEDKNINLEILSYITHFTNGRKKREHFAPHDVRAKRQSDHRHFLKAQFANAKGQADYEKLFEEAMDQIDAHDSILDETKKDYSEQIEQLQMQEMELEDQLSAKEDEISGLKYRIREQESAKTPIKNDSEFNAEVIFNTVKNPTPEHSLVLVDKLFSDRVIVLDSAWQSASDSSSFKHGQKLADLLYRLCTEYYEKISSGPEAQAKQVFTDREFAAKESQTVRQSSGLCQKRIFIYKEQPISMFRHLKIGVADSTQDTIRIHFHWDAKDRKIVIGHCGPHLPLS